MMEVAGNATGKGVDRQRTTKSPSSYIAPSSILFICNVHIPPSLTKKNLENIFFLVKMLF